MELFGFKFERAKSSAAPAVPESFAPPTNDDGAISAMSGSALGGSISHVLDMEGTAKTEAELINKYREMAFQPVVERAVDDIVDEAIVCDGDEDPVAIDTADIPYSDRVKQTIENEFRNVMHLLNFKTHGSELFRRWYIDGRIYMHAIIDDSAPEKGIIELRYVDPRKIRKIREHARKRKGNSRTASVVIPTDEYFVYAERGFSQKAAGSNEFGQQVQGIKISRDAMIYSTSGRVDGKTNMTVSFLHKAIRPLNLLLTMEDARVIYSMTRAPERRVWYIDVGGLPKAKADQHLRDMMTKHKNKLQYDASTGEIRDDRRFMTMLDDFWLPRRTDGKATEVTTLPGGQGLGEIEELNYFRKNLYTALNIPVSRLEPDTGFSLGRVTEVSRDEVKFSKFIWRLRNRFGQIIIDALIRQLLLKRVIGESDVGPIRRNLKLRFAADNYFAELKETEILRERINTLQQVDDYVGKFFSKKTIWTKILHLTQEEIDDEKEQMMIEAEEARALEGEDGDVDGNDEGDAAAPSPGSGRPAADDQPEQEDQNEDNSNFSSTSSAELTESNVELNRALAHYLTRTK